jgi:hypothetical protein
MKKHKKDKRRNEKKKNKYDSDSDSQEDTGKDLDALLAAKYIKLKEKLCKTDIAKLRKNQSKSSDVDAVYRHKAGEEQEPLSSHRKRKHQSDSLDEGRNDHLPARTYGLQVCSAELFFRNCCIKHHFNKCEHNENASCIQDIVIFRFVLYDAVVDFIVNYILVSAMHIR